MLIRVTSRDAAPRQGALLGAGGLAPDVVIDFCTVSVVLPPGPEVVTWDFSLTSSEQPEIPIPKPVKNTPIIVVVMIFRINFASDLEIAAARDLA